MSCDRRRAGFLAHVLAAVPDGTGKPTVIELDQVFRDACVPPRSAAERVTNEAKVRALFQAFDRAGVERPTHSATRMPATESLCAGYARLYDALKARNLLASAETRVSAPGPRLAQAQAARSGRTDRADKIKVQLDGTALEITGGNFPDMLAVIKSLPGSWFNGSTKTWVIKVDRDRLDQAMRARGYSVQTPGITSAIAAGLVASPAAAPAPAPAATPATPKTPQESAAAFLDITPGLIAIANGATGSDDDYTALVALAEAWRVDPKLAYGQQLQASRVARALSCDHRCEIPRTVI